MSPTTAIGFHVNNSSAVAEIGDCLITIYMAEKWVLLIAAVPLSVGKLAQVSSHLTQCSLGTGLPA